MIPKNIIAIGASSCEGKADPEHGGFVGRLRTWRETEDQLNSVFNLGIKGDTSTDVLNRLLVEAKPRKPDLIIFHFGTNDTHRVGSKTAQPTTSLETFKANLVELIQQGRQLAPVLFVSPNPIDETRTQPLSWVPFYYAQADLVSYFKELQAICAYLEVPYVDVFNDWLHQDYLKYLHTDGLHANALGHQNIFEQLKLRLQEIY